MENEYTFLFAIILHFKFAIHFFLLLHRLLKKLFDLHPNTLYFNPIAIHESYYQSS